VEPTDLEPQAAAAMQRRAVVSNADGRPTKKIQRNFNDPGSHLMQSGTAYLQDYNFKLAMDSNS
jgi:hypothetical protein